MGKISERDLHLKGLLAYGQMGSTALTLCRPDKERDRDRDRDRDRERDRDRDPRKREREEGERDRGDRGERKRERREENGIDGRHEKVLRPATLLCANGRAGGSSCG